MYLFEYQAKELMRQVGISVLPGAVATTESRAVAAAGELGAGPWAVKAQVLAGGRAQGFFNNDRHLPGVVFAETSLEVGSVAQSMLGSVLITPQTTSEGEMVNAVYIEPAIVVPQEVFLAMLVDGDSGQIVCLLSKKGGQHVEQAVGVDPDSLIRCNLGFGEMLTTEASLETAKKLELSSSVTEGLSVVLKKLHRLFIEKDLSLIEINPLGIRQNDALIALDARLTVDDNALFRQSKMAALGSRSVSSSAEQIALREGFNYVPLDGNVGTFSSGAGLAMATVDAVANCGARPANFLDVPPVLEVSRVKQAFLLLFSNQKINCLIVNVFGAGIMRCDTIADGLLLAHLEAPVGIPIVMRLAGTNSELAISRLEKSGLPIQFVENLEAGAEKIVYIEEQNGNTSTHSSWAKTAWLRIRNLI